MYLKSDTFSPKMSLSDVWLLRTMCSVPWAGVTDPSGAHTPGEGDPMRLTPRGLSGFWAVSFPAIPHMLHFLKSGVFKLTSLGYPFI